MASRTLTEEEVAASKQSGFVKVGGILGDDDLDRFACRLISNHRLN